MNKKRIFALAIALVMAFTLCSACSLTGEEDVPQDYDNGILDSDMPGNEIMPDPDTDDDLNMDNYGTDLKDDMDTGMDDLKEDAKDEAENMLEDGKVTE